ncbi:LysR family transcriptional regulator [Rhodoferax sp. U11-2br]|uniref:LysR family transcriptional regulator n=1 Tax=Rhodoferax sp. U11-2br TaxID=2838878 RepID=UPI001BE5644C|nr:LysR family transcriptional regulator [Rhodoferax sp. U11-2br]MBT3067127.1 LysR family transcriptional regulator [Rhodoferax sp. U11-2br]
MTNSIDLRQLRYFLAVSEELNFGRAALRLHISQPPLSRQIQQLEEQLGVALFLRGKSGVTLTEAGLAFLPEVRLSLRQVDKAITVARAATGTEGGQFVLGYTTVFDRSAIPDVVDSLQQRFPEWRIISKGRHSTRLVRDIQNGNMDAAFIGLHTHTEGLTVETVLEEPLVVALPTAHPLAKKRRLSFDDLRNEALFWFERRLNPGFYDHCQAFFNRIDFKPNVVPEPPDHHILLGLIAQGQGFGLLPASLQKVKRQGVSFRALKEGDNKLSMGIALAYAQHNPSPVLRPFIELVRAKIRTAATGVSPT